MLLTVPSATQREVVRLVLEREREQAGLERLLGAGAVAAVKTFAADGVVVRNRRAAVGFLCPVAAR